MRPAPLAAAGGTLLCLAGLVGASCGGSVEPVEEWPAGTVMVLDGVPITAAEVDAVAKRIAPLALPVSRTQQRRDAALLVVFPQVVARRAGAEHYEQARERAAAWLASLRTGSAPPSGYAPSELNVQGSWIQVSPVLGPIALEQELGVWSEPVDALGSWCLLRVLERVEGDHPLRTGLNVEVLAFSYLNPDADGASDAQSVETLLDEAELEILDPSWREIVPEIWQHRMRKEG